jgi:uncharacterized protein with HEPN domain
MSGEHADPAFLLDMITAGLSVERFLGKKTAAEYIADDLLRSAVERQIEIIGEAARKVSPATRNAHPEIPWKKIMATRHILAHDYGAIDHDIIWRIATEHIPATLAALRKIKS